MPSDLRTAQTLRLVSRHLDRFQAAVKLTAEDVRRVLADFQSPAGDRVKRFEAQLGRFARDYIDADRYASLFSSHEPVGRATVELIETALMPLEELADGVADACVVEVRPSETVYAVVSETLARLGRAFGAARLVQSIRTGRYRLNDHARSLGSFPFTHWNPSERHIAPPIIVEVPGSLLRATALSEFLDGSLKIVLVVHDDCPPAPLVRLISPGTFVVQAREVSELEAFGAWDGPGIAALVPEQCALFSHDPAGGRSAWERIVISQLPKTRPRKPIAGLSPAQQSEDLELLSMLAKKLDVAPAGTPARNAELPESEPADKLAAWLLSQANLTGVE